MSSQAPPGLGESHSVEPKPPMLDGPGRDDGLGADEIVLSDVIPGDSTALLSDHAALAGSGMLPLGHAGGHDPLLVMPPIDPLAFSDGALGGAPGPAGAAGAAGALAPGAGADGASGPCGCLSVAYYQP